MKNYYCLIVIGEIGGLEETVSKVVEGKSFFINLGKISISTFESNFSIWEIEQILMDDKRSYFLTKMEATNFTATVQDAKLQNDLFLDFVLKMTKISDESTSKTDTPKFDIDNMNFSVDIEPIDFDKIKKFIDEHKNNNFDFSPHPRFTKKNKKKKTNTEPPTLDEILDKISKVGYEKLTKFEKECLNNYSKK